LKDEVENVRRSGCEAIGVAATDHPASGLHCHFSLIVEEEYNRAGGLSFVDGHAEIKRWLDSRTTPPLSAITPGPVASPRNRDIMWLQERATRRIR